MFGRCDREPWEPGYSPRVTVQHLPASGKLRTASSSLATLLPSSPAGMNSHLPYPEGRAFLLDPFEGNAAAWPAPTGEAVLYLNGKGVETLVTDTPSLGGLDDFHSVHYAGLGRGMVFVESLANLGKLPPRGAYFIFLADSRSAGHRVARDEPWHGCRDRARSRRPPARLPRRRRCGTRA